MKILTISCIYICFYWIFWFFFSIFFPKMKSIRLAFNSCLGLVLISYFYYIEPEKPWLFLTLYLSFLSFSFLLIKARFLSPWIPLLFPIAVLLLFKTYHFSYIIGVSYISFRLSYLMMEVRDKIVSSPTLFEYMNYVFFPPLLIIGPISSYKLFKDSFDKVEMTEVPFFWSFQRILIGFFKFYFLSHILRPVIPIELLNDGYQHGLFDLLFSSLCYYFYLYFNFSGYIDIVIGASALMGVRVEENFDEPYLARNLQDFWKRWHITLANFMRDLVFTPFVMVMMKKFGSKYQVHFVSLGIFITFTLMGLWHGFTYNFFVYGMIHGFGLLVFYYYSHFLRKVIGKKIKNYNRNPFVRVLATLITLLYVSASFQFFSFDKHEMKRTYSNLVLRI